MLVMEDGPRRSGDPRNSEYIGMDADPSAMMDTAERDAAAMNRGRKFALCAIYSVEERMTKAEAVFRDRGYRLIMREPMFVHDGIPKPLAAPTTVRLLNDPEELRRLAKQCRRRPMDPKDLSNLNPKIRAFIASDGDEIQGWVKSIRCDDNTTWVSDLFVRPEYRRQGLGTQLMTTMLFDDRQRGYRRSVLLASHAGAALYPGLGYRQIGTLLLYPAGRKY
jgi:GNAT superfamily N-acetyltransferase